MHMMPQSFFLSVSFAWQIIGILRCIGVAAVEKWKRVRLPVDVGGNIGILIVLNAVDEYL